MKSINLDDVIPIEAVTKYSSFTEEMYATKRNILRSSIQTLQSLHQSKGYRNYLKEKEDDDCTGRFLDYCEAVINDLDTKE